LTFELDLQRWLVACEFWPAKRLLQIPYNEWVPNVSNYISLSLSFVCLSQFSPMNLKDNNIWRKSQIPPIILPTNHGISNIILAFLVLFFIL
jgi:hypothetical protein